MQVYFLNILFVLAYIHIPAQDTDYFKIEPQYSAEELRTIAIGSQPPFESGIFREPNLIELKSLDSTFKYDIRYAGEKNFMGLKFYKSSHAFLQKPAALSLLNAHNQFKELGYGIVIFDAYRPWFVTKMFWEGTPDSLRHFVANPDSGSRHNRGCAVDISLYELETGKIVKMPSGYDEFTERAYPDYAGTTKSKKELRDLLIKVMKQNGFTVYKYEWWHFDYKDWKKYPIINDTFSQLLKN